MKKNKVETKIKNNVGK